MKRRERRRKIPKVYTGPEAMGKRLGSQSQNLKKYTCRLIESITTLWKGRGNQIQVFKICNP